MSMNAEDCYMFLNDKDTYSSLEGCMIVDPTTGKQIPVVDLLQFYHDEAEPGSAEEDMEDVYSNVLASYGEIDREEEEESADV